MSKRLSKNTGAPSITLPSKFLKRYCNIWKAGIMLFWVLNPLSFQIPTEVFEIFESAGFSCFDENFYDWNVIMEGLRILTKKGAYSCEHTPLTNYSKQRLGHYHSIYDMDYTVGSFQIDSSNRGIITLGIF